LSQKQLSIWRRENERKATAFQPLAILVLTLCVSLCTACKAEKGPRPKIGPGGYDVVVIEQHDKVGGYMTAFERGHYRFEISLHAWEGLTSPEMRQPPT
jgi:hypothetical protein